MADPLPKIFVFCRPYLLADFKSNLMPLQGKYNFEYLVDGKCKGSRDTRKRFYDGLKDAQPVKGWSAEEEFDVITRCRLLRNLPFERAQKMMRSMTAILTKELDDFRPVAILSQMVDEYVTHILSILARKRGIRYVGYAYSYFTGKSQLSLFSEGWPISARTPDDAEIEAELARVSQRTYRQNYQQPTNYSRAYHLRRMLRYYAKRAVFFFKRHIENDPLSLHYTCLPYVVERRRWADFGKPDDFHSDWRERIAEQKSTRQKPVVYFPLAYYPEATTNYWISNTKILDYEAMALEICRSLAKTHVLIVKEHLHMLGARNPAFHRHLLQIAGVVSVPPLQYSNDLTELADVILIGGGSIGVESYLRDRPIVSFCDSTYWFRPARAKFLDLSTLETWPKVIEMAIENHVSPSVEDKKKFMHACLSTTMRVEKKGAYWPICAPEDVERVLRSAIQIEVQSDTNIS
jgi:hypothetical protein